MTLEQLKSRVLSFDPHDIVTCEMDGFDPYLMINYPDDVTDVVENQLTDNERELWWDWIEELTSYLRQNGEWKSFK